MGLFTIILVSGISGLAMDFLLAYFAAVLLPPWVTQSWYMSPMWFLLGVGTFLVCQWGWEQQQKKDDNK